jgi:hypothetical protein
MNDRELPEELRQLESELMALPRSVLSTSLRTSLDRDMRSHLRGDRRRRWYAYVAAAAAVAAVWANLSLRAATATNFYLTGRPEPANVAALENQLHELLPELDPREIQRHVVMLQVGSQLAPRPTGHTPAARPSRLLVADMDQLL